MAEYVKVPSSAGGTVQIEIVNLTEFLSYLKELGYIAVDKAGMYMIQAGHFVQNELQASIMGERGEPRSVRTGRLANSITVEPVQMGDSYIIKIKPSDLSFYPDSNLSTADVAKILENDRHHVENTRNRTKDQVVEIIKGNMIDVIKGLRMR